MLDERLLTFIIMLILIYTFEHKIIPQIGVISIGLLQIIVALPSITSQIDGLYIVLYIIAIVYSSYMIVVTPEQPEGEYI